MDANIFVYPLTKTETSMGYVQGMNRGNLQDNLMNSLDLMNSYSGVGNKYKKWYYNSADDTLSFENKPIIKINNTGYNFKLLTANIKYDESTFRYEWYLDGNKQDCAEKEITLKPSLEKDRELKCKLYSGTS